MEKSRNVTHKEHSCGTLLLDTRKRCMAPGLPVAPTDQQMAHLVDK